MATNAQATNAKKFEDALREATKAIGAAQSYIMIASDAVGDHAEQEGDNFAMMIAGQLFEIGLQLVELRKNINNKRREYTKRIIS